MWEFAVYKERKCHICHMQNAGDLQSVPQVLSTSCCGVKIHNVFQPSVQGREELLQEGAIRETNTGVINFQILPFPGMNMHKFRIALGLTLGVCLTNSLLQQQLLKLFLSCILPIIFTFAFYYESQDCCWGAVKCFLPAPTRETGILWTHPSQLSCLRAGPGTCSSPPPRVSE